MFLIACLKRDNPLDKDNNANNRVSLEFDSYKVYSDNNGDSIINKGETIRLNVSLKNTGTGTAKAVKATFSTTSSYVSNLTPTTQISYGDIAANSIKWENTENHYAIQFTVSTTTPNNTNIPIDINIVDENGNTWTSSFDVTVSPTDANVTYNSFNIYSDNNNDGIINKGETLRLNVSLENTGTATAKGVKATFTTTSSYVSNLTPTTQISYGDIAADSVAWYQTENYYVIQFTVSATTPNNTSIPIDINIVDENGNTWTSSFDVTTDVVFDMVFVQGGTTILNGKTVTINTFTIGKYEITQKIWEKIMEYSGTTTTGTTLSATTAYPGGSSYMPNATDGKGDNYPVYYVSYEDIVNIFLPRLNAITGKNYRLPTEAEWEYAAKGGQQTHNYIYSGSNTIDNVAWYARYGIISSSHIVGTKLPNELGIYDMSGNVGEWCRDWYGSTYPSGLNNPTGTSSGSRRVIRGGSRLNYADGCTVSIRNEFTPSIRYFGLGFRLVLVP
jgi:hypothetical protein